MKCVMCKTGNLAPGTKTVLLEKEATILVFKQVPALVCDQCGEGYTDEDVTDRLLRFVEEEAKKGPREDFVQYSGMVEV